MPERESERVVLLHSCAFCGEPAALPAAGGLQLSVVDAVGRAVGWAVHRECLERALHVTTRAALRGP